MLLTKLQVAAAIFLSLIQHVILLDVSNEQQPKIQKSTEADKLALLFLTYHDLNQVQLWKEWLSGHEDKYTIYVHSKRVPDDDWLASFRISNIVDSTWENTMKA